MKIKIDLDTDAGSISLQCKEDRKTISYENVPIETRQRTILILGALFDGLVENENIIMSRTKSQLQ